MNLDIKKMIGEQAEKDIAACDSYLRNGDPSCRKCIDACPAGRDPSITITELNQVSLGRITPGAHVYDFAFSCMQTAKCTLACPLKLKRDVMMLQLRSILDKPRVHKKYNMLRGTENGAVGKILQKGFEWKNSSNLGDLSKYLNKPLHPARTLFYFGCYLNTPEICSNTLSLAKIFGEDNFEVLGGLKTCCGYPQYLQGNFSLSQKYMENLFRDICRVQPETIITSCMECYAALQLILENSELNSNAITTTEWILKNSRKIDFSGIKKENIIFHDSCMRCHKMQKCSGPRDLLEKFADVDEFKRNKQNSLCCTYYSFNYNPVNRSNLHNIKKDEIKRKHHHTLVTECVTCDDAFNKGFKDEEFEVKNLVDYLADRLSEPNKIKKRLEDDTGSNKPDEQGEQYECNVCQWVYDENKGDPDGGISPGTKFEDIPDTWVCPVCGVGKDQFTKIVRKAARTFSYFGSLERASDEVEPEMRTIFNKAVTGKTEISAMRTPKQKSLWGDIVILPAQLANTPVDEQEGDVDFKTVIGTNAKKPLEINLPFFTSHMSFGSLSREAKVALSKGSATVKTAICSGEGGMLPEERTEAYKYIFEYSTGRFGATEDVMKQADAIDIKIGQAAKAGLGGHLPGEKVSREIARVRNIEPLKTVISPAHHLDIKTKEDWRDRVSLLREVTGGVPIGLKIVASHIEDDLAAALFMKPDFITIDCRCGATGAAPTHVKDNVCIPAPYAVHRARKFLDEHNAENITLIVTGGFRTSADIVKAIAMGADAIGISTAAMIGIGCQQYRVCHKGTCPMGIATQDPKLRKVFDIEQSAEMLKNLYTVYRKEMADLVRITGKLKISDVNTSDLSALSREISEHTYIKHA